MNTLSPIGLIAAITRSTGFLNEDRLMDPTHQIKEAWTTSSKDRRFRFTSSVLRHGHVMTEIHESNHLVFSAQDYAIQHASIDDKQRLSAAILGKCLDTDFSALLDALPSVAHFALLDLASFTPQNGWLTHHDEASERRAELSGITLAHRQSLFNTTCLQAFHQGKSVADYDFIWDEKNHNLTNEYRSNFIYNIENTLKSKDHHEH
ncbi:MAG: hypothetical protein RSD49_01490 [Hafnia sp.]